MFDRLCCLLGFHDWRSIEAGSIPPSEYVSGGIHFVNHGRTFWDNYCVRCDKAVGPTYPYEKSKRRLT